MGRGPAPLGIAAGRGREKAVGRMTPDAARVVHRVGTIKLIRTAFLRGLGVLIGGLVVTVGVEGQDPL